MVERTPLLARSFQTLLGIRTYVQKSIRYLEKVRRRSNFASLLNRITIIMFADNFLMLTVTVAFFFFNLTLQKQHILVMQLLLTVSSFCFGWIFPCSYP